MSGVVTIAQALPSLTPQQSYRHVYKMSEA